MTKLIKIFRYVRSGFVRYWPMIIWICLTSSIFYQTYNKFKTGLQYYYLRSILGWWLCVSRGTAPVLIMCSILVLLPVCRSLHTILHCCLAKISSRILASWLSKIKMMHMVCATTLIIFSFIHTGAHIMNAIYFSRHYTALYPDINFARYKGENPALLICTWTGYTGIAMLCLLLLMAATSTTKFRTNHFNTFYITHHLFVIYLLLLITHPFSGVLKEQYNIKQHQPGCISMKNLTRTDIQYPAPTTHLRYCEQPPKFKCIHTQSWIWIMTALVIYIIELGYRKYRGNPMEAIEASQVIKNAVHLKLKNPMNFHIKPGQYVLLQCSEISNIEWHPFTVTKCPSKENQNFEVLISVRGDWTKSLHSLVKSPFCFNQCNSYITRLHHSPMKFLVDGPFTSPMQEIQNCKFAICVAAGIGITPYIATLRKMLTTKTETPRRLHLLWLTRDPKQLLWYSKLLCDLQNKFWNENKPDRLQVQLFVTKDYKKRDVDNICVHQSIQGRTFLGRPNWKDEFRIWNFMYKRNRISMFCCGPKSLTRELKRGCSKENRKGYSYTFIHEGF